MKKIASTIKRHLVLYSKLIELHESPYRRRSRRRRSKRKAPHTYVDHLKRSARSEISLQVLPAFDYFGTVVEVK